MNEVAEMWNGYKDAQKQRRRGRLPRRVAQITSLRKTGFKVEQITPYQYRINDTLDLYPIHNRFHNLSTGQRGGYRDAVAFVNGLGLFKEAKDAR